jgi:membrane protease YdiL (CAAX protease family)
MLLVVSLSGGWTSIKGLSHGWNNATGAALIVICLSAGLLIYLRWLLIRLDDVTLGKALNGLGLQGASWWLFIVYYSLVNPWIEESFWRGWYPRQLRRPLIADLLFAGYHVFALMLFVGTFWAFVGFFAFAGTAWLWRNLARRHCGLLIPVVSHIVTDVSIITAAAMLARQ